MIFTVSFKTPDAVHYALEDIDDQGDIDKAQKLLGKFVEYGECVDISFNTDDGTATVISK